MKGQVITWKVDCSSEIKRSVGQGLQDINTSPYRLQRTFGQVKNFSSDSSAK